MLTNSEGGAPLLAELVTDDWALRRFAGVSNLPAEPRALTQVELAPYEGRYTRQIIDADGSLKENEMEIKGDNGQLHATLREGLEAAVPVEQPPDIAEPEDTPPAKELRLVFYRDEYVLVYDESGVPNFRRANFLPGADGDVAALRWTALPAPGGFRSAAGDGRTGLGGQSTASTTTTASMVYRQGRPMG